VYGLYARVRGEEFMSLLYWSVYGGIILAGILIATGLNDALWHLATSFM
jgi:hypothetical protein